LLVVCKRKCSRRCLRVTVVAGFILPERAGVFRFRAQQDGCERSADNQFGQGVRNLPVGVQVSLHVLRRINDGAFVTRCEEWDVRYFLGL
jgi:hypothetical protein